MRFRYAVFVCVGLPLVCAGCRSSRSSGGEGTAWAAAETRAAMYEDERAVSAAMLDALSPLGSVETATRVFGPCAGKPTRVLVAGHSSGESKREELARGMLESRVAFGGCHVVTDAIDAVTVRLLVLSWGWQVEGIESTTTGPDIELRRTRARIRARADIEVDVLVPGNASTNRFAGASGWREIAAGSAWPRSQLPVVDSPSAIAVDLLEPK